jgi:hypothetical protein
LGCGRLRAGLFGSRDGGILLLEEKQNHLDEERSLLNEEQNHLEEERSHLDEERSLLNEEQNHLEEERSRLRGAPPW